VYLRTLSLTLILLAFFQPAIVRADTPASDAHAKLDEILHQPEFTAWRLRQDGKLPDLDNPYSERWAEMIKKPFRAVRNFWKWMFPGKSSTPFSPGALSGDGLSIILKMIAWALVAAVVIFLGIVLVRVLGSTPQNMTIANVLSREQVLAAMESGDALALGSTQWMDEARRLAGEQDFRAVYRALYLALLSGLHSAGKIEHNRNRTNWVYVLHYRGPANERDRFSELTELFDRVWYGRKPAEGSNLEQLRLDVDRLTSAKGAA
jgi:hypothetical protein